MRTLADFPNRLAAQEAAVERARAQVGQVQLEMDKTPDYRAVPRADTQRFRSARRSFELRRHTRRYCERRCF